MTAGHAIAFLLFAMVAASTPGPGNLILTSTGAAVGVLRGLPALVGQVVGMGLMLFLVAFGLGGLVLTSPLITQGLKWCGIGFQLWLVWKIATAGRGEAPKGRVCIGFGGAAAFNGSTPRRGWSAPARLARILKRKRAPLSSKLSPSPCCSSLLRSRAVLSGWRPEPACSSCSRPSGPRASST